MQVEPGRSSSLPQVYELPVRQGRRPQRDAEEHPRDRGCSQTVRGRGVSSVLLIFQ
jgi:hypothetical protein